MLLVPLIGEDVEPPDSLTVGAMAGEDNTVREPGLLAVANVLGVALVKIG